jgi:hypothetical protein
VDELLARFRGDLGAPPRDDVAILAVRVAEASRPPDDPARPDRAIAAQRDTTIGPAATGPA